MSKCININDVITNLFMCDVIHRKIMWRSCFRSDVPLHDVNGARHAECAAGTGLGHHPGASATAATHRQSEPLV